MGNLANRAQGQQLQQLNPKKQLQSLLSRSWDRIAAVMPREMNPQRLYQMYVSTINREPQLANCDVESVLSCFMRCTSLGLEPSNVNGLGMVYILPYGNKNKASGLKEAQLIIGYKGMIELARRSGNLKSIHAQAVYKGDEYEHWEDESGQHFKFRGNSDADHLKQHLTDVYVNAQLMNGGFVFETMTRAEVEQVKRRSASGDRGPWGTDYEAMALKTVIRRSFKYLPVSIEAKDAAAVDETTPDYSDLFRPVLPEAQTADEALVDAVETTDATVGPEQPQQAQVPNGDRLAPMWEAFAAIGFADKAEIKPTLEKIIGHELADPNDLTDAELEKVMADFDHSQKKQS
jgi:recombination protein RecT